MIVNDNGIVAKPVDIPFSTARGTRFEGLHKPTTLIVIVVTLLTYGCPVQAIVHAFELDERTMA
jgi:hypothetical protein